MNSFWDRIKEFYKSRLFILLCGVFVLFSLLIGRLFFLQIVEGEQHLQELKTTVMRKLTIPASRGNIYDRYGRPLAINQVAFSVKIDDSVTADVEDTNRMLLSLVQYLDQKGEPITDHLPITKTRPYSFTFQDDELEKKWKQSVGLKKKQLKLSAEEVMEYFTTKFEIPDSVPEETKRKIISLGSSISSKNLMILSLIQILEENGETLVDDVPISPDQPYTFLFDDNLSKETEWKKSVGMTKPEELKMTAEETIDYLSAYFGLPQNLSYPTRRKAISIRYSLYLQRYRKYQPITVALDISDKTVANIEERQTSFPGVMIDTDSLRSYPAGEYFSHILGYIRQISDTEYERLKEYGYSNSDIVGKSGVEYVKELDLNGTDGEMLVEVDSVGRRISTIETKQPISGKNVFLTLDQELQVKAYQYLEETLRDVLINKLTSGNSKTGISIKTLFTSMVDANSISFDQIWFSTDGIQSQVRQEILNQEPDFQYNTTEDKEYGKQLIIKSIDSGKITSRQMVLVLYEQGKITADEEYLAKIQNGAISPLSVIIAKLRSGEIRPSDTNLDPCTGSVVVVDVHTGDTLALVTYPSYDNNYLVNNFNNSYYNQLLSNPTTPLVNRPLSQNKAPGSTFKMISALAGLESGVITPNTYIRDLGQFKKASTPYPKCWIFGGGGGTHSSINVSTALEVSCNYFFYETAFRMGNAPEGTSVEAINTLMEYSEAFGLNSHSGLEIGDDMPHMASPEYKEKVKKQQNPDATTSQTRWVDGDTIRAAIGQSVHNYAPVHMAKYIATLANGGTRYRMHLLDRVENPDGSISEQTLPEIENVLQLDPKNLQAVFKGMLLVTQGDKGTFRVPFRDFPINVAAKSGTAQEDLRRDGHSWFVGFAPYENPQISVTVMIPYGEVSGGPTAVIARKIIGDYMGLSYEPENTNMDNVLMQ